MTLKEANLTALDQEVLLSLHGPEAISFLQGQTTTDLGKLGDHGFAGGAFCDPKGRVLCDFLVLKVTPEAALLRVHESVASQLEAHLQKFLMFSKATLERDNRSVYGLCKTQLPASVQADHFSPESTAIPFEDGYLLQRESSFYEYWGQETGAIKLMAVTQLSVRATDAMWYLHSIRRGEARITQATWGKYLPQDLNYDLHGWVSFNKGCYTGQEVIARLHWRGTPKRRLYGGTVNTTLTTTDNHEAQGHVCEGKIITNRQGKTCGSVVNVVRFNNVDHIVFEGTGEAGEAELLIADSSARVTDVRALS